MLRVTVKLRGTKAAAPRGSADEHATGEGWVEGEQAQARGVVGQERPDVRAAARPGPGHYLGPTVAVQVGRRHPHAASERRGVREDVPHDRPAGAEDAD